MLNKNKLIPANVTSQVKRNLYFSALTLVGVSSNLRIAK